MSGDAQIIFKATGVRKAFGGVVAVDEVSLDVTEGSVTAIIGPNGAGKTTLFNALTGFDRTDAGTIEFRGQAIHRLPAWQIARRGVVRSFQTPVGFPKLSVWENLMTSGADASETLSAALFRRGAWVAEERATHERVEALLSDLGLSADADRYLEDLTAGDTKLVDFGRLLMRNPKMLLLDEPAAGVAPDGIGRLSEQIHGLRDRGITSLIIDHNIEFVFAVADYVYVMAEGRVVTSGPPSTVANDPVVAEIYLGSKHDATER